MNEVVGVVILVEQRREKRRIYLCLKLEFHSRGLAKKMHKPSQGGRQHVLEALGD